MGVDSATRLVREAVPHNGLAMVISDPVIASLGIVEKLESVLKKEKIDFRIYADIHAEPSDECVYSLAEVCEKSGATSLLALGGGSVIDAAKAASVVIGCEQKDLRWYDETGTWVSGQLLPLFAIPTTAGTGSETTLGAVISCKQNNTKMTIRGEPLIPAAAALDPGIVAGAPAHIVAATGLDALTHAVEALVSTGSTPLTCLLAKDAIRLICSNIMDFFKDSQDLKACENMLLGSYLAGSAFANAGLGLVHSLAEAVGSECGIGHGRSCAMFLPAVCAFNAEYAVQEYAFLARELGVDTTGMSSAEACVFAGKKLKELSKTLGIPQSYAQAGVSFTPSDRIVEWTARQFTTKCNPRTPSESDIIDLYNSLG